MAAEYVQGWLISGGINNDLPNAPVRPGNALPGGPPGHIDNSLPPPPGIWPPGVDIWPPIALPPGYPMPPGSIWPPVHPPTAGQPLPGGPPGGIASNPIAPGGEQPDAGLPPTPGHPDHDLPIQPGHPGNALPSGRFLVAIVGGSAATGWKVIGWTVVDPSLSAGMPLPGGPPGGIASNPIAPGGERPGHGLPPAPARPGGGPAPTPEPKR